MEVEGYRLCSWCLKRLTGREGEGEEPCYICNGVYRRFGEISLKLAEELKGYEFESFMLGARVPQEWLEREDRVRAELKLGSGVGLKKAILIELGRRVEALTGKPFSLKPDLTAIYDFGRDEIEIQTRPLYVFGRYLKLVRGIPQRGRGGVGELISGYLKSTLGGRGVRLTWFGSEDPDSLVLGSGRPFIARVSNPRLRSLKAEEADLDGVKLRELRVVSGASRPRFRVEAKLYLKCEGEPSLKPIDGLLVRLRGRKGVKERRIYELRPLKIEDGVMELYLKCEGGIGFKRLIKEGEPSLESVLGSKLEPLDRKPFDILSVELESPIR